MEKRRLGNSDLELSTVGLGAWAIGGGEYVFGWGSQDDKDSLKAIEEALDAGINWIDTAPIYGLGRSEEVVGRAVQERRSEVIISTKCGLVWKPGTRKVSNSLQKESVISECNESLRRLQTDVIDIYHIHWPVPDEQIEEAWEAISLLVRQGKVRWPAVSNFSTDQMDRASRVHPITSLQPSYSMISRGAEEEIMPYCRRHGIGMTIYSPMKSGLLSGSFTRERAESLPGDDWRRRNHYFQEPELSANLTLASRLAELASDYGRTAGALAVAWTLRRSEVTSAIVGARKAGQILDTAAASGWTLDDELLKRIDELLEEHGAAIS